MNILLASKSQTRAKLLKNAGIKFETVSHGVDEEEVKLSMSSQSPKEIAVKLNLKEEDLHPFGHHTAKINLESIKKIKRYTRKNIISTRRQN